MSQLSTITRLSIRLSSAGPHLHELAPPISHIYTPCTTHWWRWPRGIPSDPDSSAFRCHNPSITMFSSQWSPEPNEQVKWTSIRPNPQRSFTSLNTTTPISESQQPPMSDKSCIQYPQDPYIETLCLHLTSEQRVPIITYMIVPTLTTPMVATVLHKCGYM